MAWFNKYWMIFLPEEISNLLLIFTNAKFSYHPTHLRPLCSYLLLYPNYITDLPQTRFLHPMSQLYG